ncbi:MAG: DNA polymerase I [Bacteroidia bacterium]|nr:DNA polymerase I [Bacteroidia bacterium]
MAKVYIIDGNSLLFRAYYATAYGPNAKVMRTKDGIPTNALFAFGNMINKIISSFKGGEHLIVGFETSRKTFRSEEFADYKANRKPTEADLIAQMPLARELLKSLGIFVYEQDGFEADDVCGTVSKLASKAGHQVIVYTSDRDFLQLIDHNIAIHILKTGLSNIMVMDEITMPQEFGIQPAQIPDYKGLRGDASDNLPGIPGIGEKTAVKLLQEFGTFEKIVEEAPNIKGKVGESIIENQKTGFMSKRLATIKTDIELPFTLDDILYRGFVFDEINAFGQRYELKQLLNRLPAKLKIESQRDIQIEYERIASLSTISLDTPFAIFLDMKEENYFKTPILGLAISDGKKHYYMTIDDVAKDESLRKILEDESIKKACFDAKATTVALHRLGISLHGVNFDLLLASYLLDSSLKNNVDAVLNYFGVDAQGKEENALSLFDESNPLRSAKVAYLTVKLMPRVLDELKKHEAIELFHNIELPLATVLAKMEIEGFPLDVRALNAIGEQYRTKLNVLTKDIYDLAGEDVNINSPKQIADLLFNKLGLPGNRKDSTSVDALKKLTGLHPIVEKILEYRKYAKLLSTYIDGLAVHVHADGKLHAIFNQALTTTGRLSSSEPNLQNISIRDEEGRLIRQAFYYDDDEYRILSLDYSQIELRILASLSKCQAFIEVFNREEDVHAATAKAIFGDKNSTSRRKAKAVNFGIIYGISDWGLSEQLDIAPKEAKAIIDSFFEAYPEVGEYMQSVVDQAFKNGYVSTLLGRRRYLRELYDSNYQVREFARRAAMNAPIQGTAADLIKLAMVKVQEMLETNHYKTRLVLQIHDELLFKVHNSEIDEVRSKISEIMENVLPLAVKLKVEGVVGKTWYDAK